MKEAKFAKCNISMQRQNSKFVSLALVLFTSILPFASASDTLCDRWAKEPVSKKLIQSCRGGDERARYSVLLDELERSESEEEKTTLSWLRVDMLAHAELVNQKIDTISALELLSKIPRSTRADRNFLAWKIRNQEIITLEKQQSIKTKPQKALSWTPEQIRLTKLSDRALSHLRFAAAKDHPEANFEMARWTLSSPSKPNYALKAQQFADKAISLGFKVPAEFKLELRAAHKGSDIGEKDLLRAKEICRRWGKTRALNVHADLCYELDWFSRYELIKNAAAAQTDESDRQPYLWEMVLLRVQAQEDDMVLDSSESTLSIMNRVMRDDPQKHFVFYQLNKPSAATDPNVINSLQLAADSYYADANRELARLYFTGESGIPKDSELAKKYIQRSKISSDKELAKLEQRIKEEQEREALQEQRQLEIIAARERRLLTGSMDPVCDRWARSDVTLRLTDQCSSLTIDQQYALLKSAAYSPGSYESKQALYWEIAQVLLEAEQSGIDLDSHSASNWLAMINKKQDPEMFFVSWLANKKSNRSRAYDSLKRAAKYKHPVAYYELAQLTLSGDISQKKLHQTLEYLDEAQGLGFETPTEFIIKIENAKIQLQQLELRRVAEEEKANREKAKRELELAQLQIPKVNIGVMDEALHKHLVHTASVGDAALGPALGFAPGITYSCDSTHCYALGGIVKFRFDIESVSSCKYTLKIYADCYFKYRLNQESGIALDQWRDNLLRGLTSAKQLSGYASLKFSDTSWKIVRFNGN